MAIVAATRNSPTPILDFTLPPEREAHEPPEARGLARDGVRLLVSYRNSERLVHARFTDLPGFLRPGDLVVVNVSATLPAALTARRGDGTTVALHLSTHLPAGLSVAEFRKVTPSAGEVFTLPGGASAVALVPYPRSTRLWVARLDLPEPLLPYLRRWGEPIAYPYVHGRWPLEMYQTVYAAVPASLVGREQEIEIGPMSGRSNVIFWLEKRGLPATDDIVDRVFSAAKASNRTLTRDQIHTIIDDIRVKA